MSPLCHFEVSHHYGIPVSHKSHWVRPEACEYGKICMNRECKVFLILTDSDSDSYGVKEGNDNDKS